MNGLRPRQIKAIDDIRAAYRAGYRAPVLVASTGFGKTHTSAEIIRSAVKRGKRVWFLAHLREILEATSGKLHSEKIPHGRIMANWPGDGRLQVQVASVQTLVRRLERMTPPDLIIVDEAHLAVAETYQKIFEWAKAGPKYGAPNGSLLLHLTATPQRLDGRGLSEVADALVPTCSMEELVDEGLLAPLRYYAPATVNLIGVRMIAGDYAKDELAAAMDKPKITGSAVAHFKKYAHGRQAIAFCCSIEHATHVAAEFRQAGYRAVAISGDSDTIERRKALEDLKAGRIDIVCNCALWVAGVDVPNVSCIILLAPTQSVTKYLQSVGRGMRTHPGKPDCIVLDHANLAATHGLPEEPREWSLEGKRKSAKDRDPDDIPVKSCPRCLAAVRSIESVCKHCGHVFEIKAREIQQVDGELQEIDKEALRKQVRREQASARTLEDLIELGASRGYKNPKKWAEFVFKARDKKKSSGYNNPTYHY